MNKTEWEKEENEVIELDIDSVVPNYREESDHNRLKLERFKAILNHSGEGILIANSEDRQIIDVNDFFVQLSGYAEDELLNMKLDAILPDFNFGTIESLSPMQNYNQQTLLKKGGTPLRVELRPCRTRFEEVEYHLIYLQNLSEETEVSKALMHSEFNLKAIFDSTFDGIFIHDFAGNVIDVNDRVCDMYGVTRQSALNFNIARYSADLNGQLDKIIIIINELNYKKEIQFEWIAQNPITRQTFDVEVTLKKILWYGKTAVLAIIRDISRRKRNEFELKQKEARFRELVETLPFGIFETNLQGEITLLNKAAYSYFEVTEIKFQNGLNLNEILKIDNIMTSDLVEYLVKLKPAGIEFVAKTIEKQEFPVLLYVTPLYVNHLLQGLRGIIIDISEQKKVTEERNKLEEQFLQSQKMEAVGRLAGGISHDFNNLITVINGNLSLAQTSIENYNPAIHFIDEAIKAAERAATLTRQLLTFSRKQIIETKVLNLNDVLESTEKMVSRLIGEDVKFTLQLESELWKIKADRGQLEQIIVNMIVNSRDAMENGGDLLVQTYNISFSESVQQKKKLTKTNYIVLRISDSGCGMSDETKAKLYEPFYTTKPKGQGTGLGLATVYGIVEQHGGFIEMDSHVNQGTTFFIFFPKTEEMLTESLKGFDQQMQAFLGNETILFVEDEHVVRDMTSRLLMLWGYRVLTCQNAKEAFETVYHYKGEIDLIFTDVIMPEINGSDLVKRIQETLPEIKVLYTSGYADNIIGKHGVLDDGTNFIAKPYTLQNLAKKIREVIEKG